MSGDDPASRDGTLDAGREVRIVWTAGHEAIEISRVRALTDTAIVVASGVDAPVGSEVRFELLADRQKLAVGIGKVVGADGETVRLELLAMGVDARVVQLAHGGPARSESVEAPPVSSKKGPPPLPRAAPVAAAPVAAAPDPFAGGLAPAVDDVAPAIEPLRVRGIGTIIGIDLGTTNTCAAYVVDGRPRIIPGRTGTSTIPSMITFDPDGRWYVGQRAADRQILHPQRTVYGSKRLVGRTYRADIAAELQQHFAYPLGEADGQRFGVRIDDRIIPMDTIAARVLDEVRSTAEAHLGGPVAAAVITVPAYFSDVQREAVRRAAKEANLTVHRIVNEPTAAAVAYGHKRKDGPKTRVAVWDFGGGTFDFSVVEMSSGQLDVLASGGDNFVGGSDFDDLLASHLLAEFQAREGLAFEPTPQQIARLREAAQIAKCHLSTETEHLVELPEFVTTPTRIPLSIEVTRETFEAMVVPLVERTHAIALDVLGSIGLGPGDVDDVLLVGGTTRIPAVQEALAALFGRRPSKGINPDEAVALGAAILAEELGTAPTLRDILPITIGRAVQGQRFVPIVARNTRLPAEQEVTFEADFLGSVTVPLFQGESLDVRANEYICSVIVEDRSLWDQGQVTLRLSFDEHSMMAVDAKNARTGRPLPARLDRTRSIDEILHDLEGPTPPPEEPRTVPSRTGSIFSKLFRAFTRPTRART